MAGKLECANCFVAPRDVRRAAHISNAAWRDLQFEIYVRAKAAALAQRLPFDEAKAPFEIHWYSDSYLDLPVGR
jgi:hypothetical protein